MYSEGRKCPYTSSRSVAVVHPAGGSVSDLTADLVHPIETGYGYWGRQFVRRSYGCAATRAYRRFQMAVSTPVAANADREEYEA